MFSDRFARSMERLLREIKSDPKALEKLDPRVAEALVRGRSQADPDRVAKDIYARRHPHVGTKQD